MSANGLKLLVPVAEGRLAPTAGQQAAIDQFLRTRDGRAVELKLSRPVNSRSQQQNRFLWGVVYTTIAESTGYTTEEVHELLKDKFLPRKFVTIGDTTKEVRKSTAQLSIDEFSKYLEQLAAFAAELGITLPDRP